MRILLAVACLALLLTAARSAIALTVTDDAGQQVRLEHPAQRIVSLSPHLTELLFSIGAGDRLVGVVEYSDYPRAAQSIPRVGGYNALDLERILALKPDLVVAWGSGNKQADLEKLRRFKLPLFISEPRSLGAIPETLTRLSLLTGTSKYAAKVVEQFDSHLDALREFSTRQPVRVFYQVWDEPLMSVNGKHLISDVIRLCGGRNIFADAASLTPRVSIETVIERAPQAIVVGGSGQEQRQWLQRWKQWDQIPAVRHGQLFMIDPDLLQRHTVRILQGADTLCHQLQRVREQTD